MNPYFTFFLKDITWRKLCIEASAPALASIEIFHVNPSPRARSLSSSFRVLGKALRQRSIIRGSKPLTTPLPSVMMEPIKSHPAWVLSRLNLLFWHLLAVRNNSSPTLKTSFPLVCGMPKGVCLKAPRNRSLYFMVTYHSYFKNQRLSQDDYLTDPINAARAEL